MWAWMCDMSFFSLMHDTNNGIVFSRSSSLVFSLFSCSNLHSGVVCLFTRTSLCVRFHPALLSTWFCLHTMLVFLTVSCPSVMSHLLSFVAVFAICFVFLSTSPGSCRVLSWLSYRGVSSHSNIVSWHSSLASLPFGSFFSVLCVRMLSSCALSYHFPCFAYSVVIVISVSCTFFPQVSARSSVRK